MNLAYYKETVFCNAIRCYSQIGRLALINTIGHETDECKIYGLNFFVGGAAAMHANLHPAQHSMKSWILGQDPLRFLNNADIPERDKSEALQGIVELLDAWRVGDASIAVQNQTREFRSSLTELADNTYFDTECPDENAKAFTDGFMLTSDVIWRYGNYYNTHYSGS